MRGRIWKRILGEGWLGGVSGGRREEGGDVHIFLFLIMYSLVIYLYMEEGGGKKEILLWLFGWMDGWVDR